MTQRDDQLFAEEDDLPNAPVPPLKPPPRDLDTVEPPPQGPDTEQDSPLLTVSEFSRMIGEFEIRLTNRMLQSHKDQQEEFENKLELRDKRFKEHLANELAAAGKVYAGAAEGVALELRDLNGRVDSAIDRAAERVKDELAAKLDIVAKRGEEVAQQLEGLRGAITVDAKITREMAGKAYEVATTGKHDEDRPTLTEVTKA